MKKPRFTMQTLLIGITLTAVGLVAFQQYRIQGKLDRLESLEDWERKRDEIVNTCRKLDSNDPEQRRAQEFLLMLGQNSYWHEHSVSSIGETTVHLFACDGMGSRTRVAIVERDGSILDTLSCHNHWSSDYQRSGSSFWNERSSFSGCGTDPGLEDLNDDGLAEIVYWIKTKSKSNKMAYRATESGFVAIDPKSLAEIAIPQRNSDLPLIQFENWPHSQND